jgi:LysM repeat protein
MGSQAKAINYRRRRVLAIVFLAVSLLGLAFALTQPQSAGASAKAVKANFTYVYVQSGDTLWSIARSYAPDKDPQQEIADIKNLNNLESSTLAPGQRLALP